MQVDVIPALVATQQTVVVGRVEVVVVLNTPNSRPSPRDDARVLVTAGPGADGMSYKS